MARKKFNTLPGFGLTMGFTVFYLGLIVLVPIAGLFLKASQLSLTEFWTLALDPRALASYRLTFVGLPFVVRTLQPVLEGMEREVEEVAATLDRRVRLARAPRHQTLEQTVAARRDRVVRG